MCIRDRRSPITTVEVACTGPDGTVSQYTLRIEKGGKSSDATTTTHSADHSALSALQVRTSDGSPLALRPGFSSDTMTYTVRLDDSIAGITVKPTSRYDGATIHVDGEKVSSGHWSDTLTVKKDSTQSFVIKVVGENGHTSQYTLRVVKGESTHYETSSTSQTTVQITIGSKVATVNGVQRQMEMAPLLYTYNGGQYTMVPIRFVSEELGGTVGWNNATNTATVTMDGKLVSMTIGHPNPAAGMDCPPILRDTAQGGYTFVPVRYVSESLDCEVLWDQATQTVTIKR